MNAFMFILIGSSTSTSCRSTRCSSRRGRRGSRAGVQSGPGCRGGRLGTGEPRRISSASSGRSAGGSRPG
ncbi:hypothetical protein L596_023567 [Steinernema carpocapsae]|uniref:Uncharacterized protein n=1 Tax=Steinernema carpocapsae TaxID=34508 RepID=A0A4U5ME31_STECR|nr:hypothetical protein L596_023567 [Steinernema carpocapsae]